MSVPRLRPFPLPGTVGVQQRWSSSTASGDALRAQVARARTHPFFQHQAFTDEEIARIITATRGVSIRAITPPGGAGVAARFVDLFFKWPIENAPDRSELGGEQVLQFVPIGDQREDSTYLMYFHGEQTPHSHGGPRKLDIYTGDRPCYVLLGGHKSLAANGPASFARIEMPANSYVSLSFPAHFMHGFEGTFGAVSIHYTDRQELAVKPVNTAADDKDTMATLTELLGPEHIRPIAGGLAIPCEVVRWLHQGDGAAV